MTAKYRHIIFDADHTLIDFQKDERRAFRAAFADMPPTKADKAPSIADMPPSKTQRAAIAGMPSTQEEFAVQMQAYSARNWEELGLNNVNDPLIRKEYHRRTYVHVHALFEYAQREYGLSNAAQAERTFYQTLCSPSLPIDGALEIVKELSQRYAVSVATNGLSDMQNARLVNFKPCLHRLFISEEMGTIKPAEEFGEMMLDSLQARAEECLFVGDSLSSDMALAGKLNMDAIWYNPDGRTLPEGYRIKAQIRTLQELFKYI